MQSTKHFLAALMVLIALAVAAILVVVVVLLVSSALTLFYGSGWFRGRTRRLPWLVACSAAAALLTALSVV